jgi:predicted SnoaL-like aldol condensation-catalyzing enzyme
MSATREAVERYNLELWNNRRYDIAPEIIGDEIVRNSPGRREILSHTEAVDRVRRLWATVEHVEFTLLHTIVEDDLCTIIYQADMRRHDGTRDAIASIEVFRVANGRIVEVWNNTHDNGRWPGAKEIQP